jgi:hypothetical protein
MNKLRSVFFAACILMFATKSGAQEITSFKGLGGEEFYRDNQKISRKQMDSLMALHPVTNMYWRRKKKQLFIGMVATTANIGASVWWIVNSGDHKNVTAPVVATAGTFILAAIFNLAGNRNKKKAILAYNDALDKKTTFTLAPIATAKGVGLALKF